MSRCVRFDKLSKALPEIFARRFREMSADEHGTKRKKEKNVENEIFDNGEKTSQAVLN
jgi:hypothetical protein